MEVRSRTYSIPPIERATHYELLFVPPLPDFPALAFVHRVSRDGLRVWSLRACELGYRIKKG
jgi:hypothetical protein